MLRRLRPLFRRARVERELDAELRYDLEQRAAALMAAGMAAEEARRQARLDLGGLEQVKEQCREARSIALLESLGRDCRYGLRSLARNRSFTAAAVLSLALGIGANTALFSLLDQMLVRPLPVRDPEELVVFRSFGPSPGMNRNSGMGLSFSWPKYKQFRNQAGSFRGVAARYGEGATLSHGGQTERIRVELVSGNYFDVLGVGAAAGRVLEPADDRTWRAEPYAVLSYEYWTRRFGADAGIIGQPVRINDTIVTVVGVSARGFHGVWRGESYDVRLPMMMKSFITPTWPQVNNAFWAWANIIARLKPGVSRVQAEAEANVLYRQILAGEVKLLPDSWGIGRREREEFVRRKLELLPGARGMFWSGGTSPALLTLAAMVAVVLLIACVNVAGLLLARTAARRREIAVRIALGAARRRVARQFFLESLLLACAGGAVGLLLAINIGRPLLALVAGEDGVRMYAVAPDARVLAFTLAAAALTALLCGIAAPLEIARTPLSSALKDGSGASAGVRSVRFRRALVVCQVAFCVLLASGAALFARTLYNLRRVDLGFDRHNLVTFSMDASLAGYEGSRSQALYRAIEARLAAIPGVDSAAAASSAVLKGGINIKRFEIPGFQPEHPDDTAIREIAVTPAYFRSLRLSLLAGRPFQESDYQRGRAAIVNQAFARRYLNGADPLARVLRDGNAILQIVGMIRDEKYMSLREEPRPSVYVPVIYSGDAHFYVRTARPPAAVVPEIRRAMQSAAPGVPLYELRTMDDQVEQRLHPERTIAILAVCFGTLALGLAAVGLYGVVSYVVAARTREIGVRLALGAGRRAIFGMVMRDVAGLLAPGLVLGLLAALAAGRYVESSLYGIGAADPLSLSAAAAVCLVVAGSAGSLPARRATRIDPVDALRWE